MRSTKRAPISWRRTATAATTLDSASNICCPSGLGGSPSLLHRSSRSSNGAGRVLPSAVAARGASRSVRASARAERQARHLLSRKRRLQKPGRSVEAWRILSNACIRRGRVAHRRRTVSSSARSSSLSRRAAAKRCLAPSQRRSASLRLEGAFSAVTTRGGRSVMGASGPSPSSSTTGRDPLAASR